jgi:PAS domain S-box-containing protein
MDMKNKVTDRKPRGYNKPSWKNFFPRRLRSVISWLVDPKKQYMNKVQEEKSRLLSIFIFFLLIAYISVDVFGPISPTNPFYYYLGYGMMVGAIILNRNVHYFLASRLATIIVPFLVFSRVLSGSSPTPITLLYFLVLGLILSSFLIRKTGIILLGLINSLGILLAPIILSTDELNLASTISPLVINLVATGLIVVKMAHNDLARRVGQSISNQDTQFSSIFYNSPLGILIAGEGSILTDVNKAACDLLGYTNDELIGMKIPDLTHPDDHDRTLEMFWKIVAAELPSFSMEVRFLKKDGRSIWVNLNTTLLFEDTGIPVYGITIIEDISNQKSAKDALELEKENLRISEERYRTLFESAQDMILIFDEKNTIINANFAASNKLGYEDCESLIGQKAKDICSECDLEHQSFLTINQEGIVQPTEYRMLRKDGSTLHALGSATLHRNDQGEITRIDAVFTDITERKLADEELQETKRMLESAIAQSPSGILIADAPDVNIKVANSAAYNIRGGDRRILTEIEVSRHSENWQTYYPDGTLYPPEKLPLSRAVLNGELTTNEVVIIRDEEGKDRWLSVNASPIYDSAGNITSGIVIFHEITERKKAENELIKSEQNLKRAQNVAHMGSWVWHTETNEMEMSDELFNIIGRDKNEGVLPIDVEGKMVHPDDQKKLAEKITRCLREKKPYSMDYRIYRLNDGKLRYLHVETEVEEESNSENVVIYGIVQDITERKEAEIAMKESESKYRDLVESSPDGIITISKKGKILSINKSFIELTGFGKKDFVGKPFLKVPTLIPQELDFYTRMLKDMLQGKTQGPIGFNWKHANGEIKSGEAKASILKVNDKIVGLQAIVRDITERKEAEDKINRHLEELQILQEVSSICLKNVDEDETIAQVTKTIGNRLYPDHFGILLLDDEGVLHLHPSYQGLVSDDLDLKLELGEGITGRVAQTNQSRRIDDVSRADDYIALTICQSSELCVPISVNGKVYGVINAESCEPGAFSSTDERLLETVADQLALALQTSRLYQAEKDRRQEAEANREASSLLTRSLDLDDVLNSILDNLRKVVDSDQASIHLFEEDAITIVAGNGFKNKDEVVGFRYSPNNQLAKEVSETKKALVLDDATNDPRFENFKLVNTRGWMGIPLIEQETVIGYLTIDSDKPGAYTQNDADRLQVFANNAASAIVKARLFEEEKKRRLEAEIQQEISAIVTQSLDLHVVLDSILINLQRYLNYDSAGIFLQENGHLRIVATRGFDNPEDLDNRLVSQDHQLYQEILKKKSVLIIENVENDDRFEFFGAEGEIRGWMGVPLIDQGEIIGYVSFDSKTPGKFTPKMGQLAQVLVNQTSSAITKAKLFEETQQGLKRLEALHDIDRIITSSVELSFAIKQILNIVVNQLNIDVALVSMYEPNSATFIPLHSVGFRSNAHHCSQQIMESRNANQIAFERKKKNASNQEELLYLFNSASFISQEELISYLGVPLIAKGEVKGVLEIFNRTNIETDKEWNDFLETLATQLAIAIDNSLMFESLQKSHMELTMAYDSTIEGWAQALELRDMETEGHSRRVVSLTMDLARKMGINGQELAHIRRGALLHDIGKMAVPDVILQKPGKLSEDEWDIMRQHPSYAKEWLSSTDYLLPALDIPYCHHEKWDGTGYPQGLKEEEIPLPARIFAIVDVWDALLSDRPYRKAWSRKKTIQYLKDQSGIHFDPKVVEAFLEMLKEEDQ